MSVKMFFKAVHEEKRPVKASVRTTQTGSVVPVQAHQANRRIADQDAQKPRQLNLFGQQDLFQRKPELAEAKRTIEDKPEPKHEAKSIGKTRSGKDIYDEFDHPSHADFTTGDHADAVEAHRSGYHKTAKDKDKTVSGSHLYNAKKHAEKVEDLKGRGKPDGSGMKSEMGQDENGMYWGEIRDADGRVESATTAKTANEIHSWLKEHGIDIKNTKMKGVTESASPVDQAKATIEADSVKEKTKDHLDNGMRQWIIEASQPGVDPDLKSSTMKHIQAVIQREGLDKKMIDAEIKKYAQKPSENSDSAKTESKNTPEKSFNPTVSYGGSGNVDNAALRLASIIDQHQRRMGGRVYAIYLPSSGKHSGKLSFQRDGERLPDGWKYITPESAIHGDLTKEQLAGRLRQHIGRLNMLPYENKTLDEHLEKLKSLKGNELETASWTQRHDKMLEAYDSADDSQKLKFMKDLKKNDLIDSVSGGKRKPLSAYDMKHAIRNHLLDRAKYGRI
jgi:hypothetical protein